MKKQNKTIQKYDHRLKDLVRTTGDIQIAVEIGVPRSTAESWLLSLKEDIVSLDSKFQSRKELDIEIFHLQKRIKRLETILRLIIVVFKVTNFTLKDTRIPEGKNKIRLLQIIESSEKVIPLKQILNLFKISSSRYGSWKRLKNLVNLRTKCLVLNPPYIN